MNSHVSNLDVYPPLQGGDSVTRAGAAHLPGPRGDQETAGTRLTRRLHRAREEAQEEAARVEEISAEEAGPMYQDPDTINRQPAPESGQLYTVVEPTKKASSQRKPPVAPAKTDAELAEMYSTPDKSRQREVGPVGGARAERGGEVCMWHGEWGQGGGGEERSAYLMKAPLHVSLIPIFGHSYYTCLSAWEIT